MNSHNSDHENTVSKNPIPDRVVHFYSNIDYALECIGLKEITFIRREKVNDPFDPWMKILFEFNNYDQMLVWEIENKPQKHVDEFRVRISESQFNDNLKKIMDREDNFRKNYFLFSTCAPTTDTPPEHNLYMWGHYANGHRGVAVEFDTKKLNNELREKNIKEDVVQKIRYSNDIPRISFEMMDRFLMSKDNDAREIFNIIDLTVRTKSINWAQENEWRLVNHKDNTTINILRVPLPDNAITHIYLGSEIYKTEEDRIVEEARRLHPHAIISKAIKCKDKIGLEFQKI